MNTTIHMVFGQEKNLPSISRSPENSSKKRSRWLGERLRRIDEHVYVEDETTATFLPFGRTVINAQKKLLSKATDHSYHQVYALDIDRVGREFLHVWRRKHAESPEVKQHVLVDNSIAWWNGNGTVMREKEAQQQKDETFLCLNELEEEGVAVVRVTNWFHMWNLLHSNPFHRDHKKITTADGNKAILGSVNTVAHHDRWLDGGVLLNGPVAKVIEQDVEDTLSETKRWVHVFKAKSIGDYVRRGFWKEALKEPDQFRDDLLGSIIRNPQPRGKRVTIHSPSGDEIQIATDSFFSPYREATRMAFELVSNAREGDTVDIISPYPGMFVLTNKMIRAASKQHAQVNLHIPHNNNYQLFNPSRAKNPMLRKVLEVNHALWKWRLKKAGVHIFEYVGDEKSQGMTHFKSVSLRKKDGLQKVFIGSSNFSMGLGSGSNREIGILLKSDHHQDFMEEYNAFMGMVKDQSIKVS